MKLPAAISISLFLVGFSTLFWIVLYNLSPLIPPSQLKTVIELSDHFYGQFELPQRVALTLILDFALAWVFVMIFVSTAFHRKSTKHYLQSVLLSTLAILSFFFISVWSGLKMLGLPTSHITTSSDFEIKDAFFIMYIFYSGFAFVGILWSHAGKEVSVIAERVGILGVQASVTLTSTLNRNLVIGRSTVAIIYVIIVSVFLKLYADAHPYANFLNSMGFGSNSD